MQVMECFVRVKVFLVATNSRKLKEGGIFLWSWTKYAQNTSDAGEGELARGWGLHRSWLISKYQETVSLWKL